MGEGRRGLLSCLELLGVAEEPGEGGGWSGWEEKGEEKGEAIKNLK